MDDLSRQYLLLIDISSGYNKKNTCSFWIIKTKLCILRTWGVDNTNHQYLHSNFYSIGDRRFGSGLFLRLVSLTGIAFLYNEGNDKYKYAVVS
jgi:hypothetical protein